MIKLLRITKFEAAKTGSGVGLLRLTAVWAKVWGSGLGWASGWAGSGDEIQQLSAENKKPVPVLSRISNIQNNSWGHTWRMRQCSGRHRKAPQSNDGVFEERISVNSRSTKASK